MRGSDIACQHMLISKPAEETKGSKCWNHRMLWWQHQRALRHLFLFQNIEHQNLLWNRGLGSSPVPFCLLHVDTKGQQDSPNLRKGQA